MHNLKQSLTKFLRLTSNNFSSLSRLWICDLDSTSTSAVIVEVHHLVWLWASLLITHVVIKRVSFVKWNLCHPLVVKNNTSSTSHCLKVSIYFFTVYLKFATVTPPKKLYSFLIYQCWYIKKNHNPHKSQRTVLQEIVVYDFLVLLFPSNLEPPFPMLMVL